MMYTYLNIKHVRVDEAISSIFNELQPAKKSDKLFRLKEIKFISINMM